MTGWEWLSSVLRRCSPGSYRREIHLTPGKHILLCREDEWYLDGEHLGRLLSVEEGGVYFWGRYVHKEDLEKMMG